MRDNLAGQDVFGWVGLKIEGYVGVVADSPTKDLLTTFLEHTHICETEEEALIQAELLAQESGYSGLYYWAEYFIPDTQTRTPARLMVQQ